MSDATDKPKRPLRRRAVAAWRALAPFARPHRRALVPGILGAIGVVAARLAVPWPLRGVLELTLHQGGTRGATVSKLVPSGADPALWLTGSFVAIIVVWALAEYVQRLSFARFAAGTVRDARETAIKRVEAKGGDTSRDPGEMLARIMGDSQRLKSGIRGVLVGATRNGLFFLGVATILLIIDPGIGLVFVTGGILSLLVACVGAHHAARLTRRFRRRETALTSRLHRTLARAAAEHDLPDERTTHKPAGRPADSKLSRIEGATTITIHLILAATTCAILVLAIHAGRHGTVSPGEVFIVLIYVTLMHNKTVSLGRLIVRLGRVVTSAERLAAVTTSKRKRERPSGPTRDNTKSTTPANATAATSSTGGRPPIAATNGDGAAAADLDAS